MKIGFYSCYDIFNRNQMFTKKIAPFGDDLSYAFRLFAGYAKKRNVDVATIDTEPLNNFDHIFFLDFPTFKNKYFIKLVNNKSVNFSLILFESELIRPDNWETANHEYFNKVFTWKDDIIDNKKYFKINYPQYVPSNTDINISSSQRTKLCSLIAGNKHSAHPLELYSERQAAVSWFEKHHPEDFDLFGSGWDRYLFKFPFNALYKLPFFGKIFNPHHVAYKGKTDSKNATLRKYRFSICYENAGDINGYITEKIFDCFFAGCIPIYLGAPNICGHIPSNTFIDKRNFKTYDELYQYIRFMRESEYIDYISAIDKYIKSGLIYPFSAEFFCETLFKQLGINQ